MDESRLNAVPLFSRLPRREREFVARVADEIDLPAGKRLVHQGDFSYEFFLIEKGTVEVLRDGEHLADLGPGDFFGETGAIDDIRRNATVVATSPLTAIVMTAYAFRTVVREMPAVAASIREAVAERTQDLVK